MCLYAWPDGVNRGELRFKHRAVGMLHAGVRFAEEQHAGHIAGVAAEHRAHVDEHQLPAPQLCAGGMRMRQGGARAAGDNRIERRSLGSAATYSVVERGGQIRFAHARPDAPNTLFECFRVQFYRAPDRRDLTLRFQHALPLDPTRDRLERRAHRHRVLQGEIRFDAHAGLLEARALNLRAAQNRDNVRQHGTGNHAYQAVHFLCSLNAIPGIGEKYRAMGQKQEHAVAACEPRQITDIGHKPDDESIELALRHLPLERRAAEGELAKGHEPVPEPATARDPPRRWLAAYRRDPTPDATDSRNCESCRWSPFGRR